MFNWNSPPPPSHTDAGQRHFALQSVFSASFVNSLSSVSSDRICAAVRLCPLPMPCRDGRTWKRGAQLRDPGDAHGPLIASTIFFLFFIRWIGRSISLRAWS